MMLTNILGFVFVIMLNMFESFMKLSQVLIILHIFIREEGSLNNYTLPSLVNCITQGTEVEYRDYSHTL